MFLSLYRICFQILDCLCHFIQPYFCGVCLEGASHNTFFFLFMFFLSSPSCFCLKLLELFDEVYDCSFKICVLGLSKVILTREF